MYGRIGKMKVVAGKREALAEVLLEASDAMPGCRSYVVATDPSDADTLWITEVWDSAESHRASLDRPAVRAAIVKGRQLIAGFEEQVETRPVGGMGADRMQEPRQESIVLAPGGGRTYEMGGLTAVFKADEAETHERLSVSEWWLAPHTEGPGAHAHDTNDEVFYVIEGLPSVLVGDLWHDASPGSCFVIPAGPPHDFANRSNGRAGLFNVFVPGGFERHMPAIVQWFRENP